MNRYEFTKAYSNIGIDTFQTRNNLLDDFDLVNKNVPCAHCEADSYYLADYILKNQNVSGSFVEFGCYAGGMSCKLSKVANLVGKKYIIFDTFSGLPSSAIYETYDKDSSYLGNFEKGMFSCGLENVKNNIKNYGCIENCIFFSGLIEDSLKDFNEKPLSIFIDVDIIETAKFIIKNLWDKVEGDRIFTHEACIKDYMDRLLDKDWWMDEMKKFPPLVGGNHLNKFPNLPSSMCLTYLIKYQSLG